MARRRLKVPPVTSPPTLYEVWWRDANHDSEHDGPSAEFDGALVELPNAGYHVKTTRTTLVLAMEWSLDPKGHLNSRFHQVIPRVHVLKMVQMSPEAPPEEESQPQ